MTADGRAIANYLPIDVGVPALDLTAQRTIEDLRELIMALDRRVPCAGRANELDIAQEAAVLRAKALARIAELKEAGASRGHAAPVNEHF